MKYKYVLISATNVVNYADGLMKTVGRHQVEMMVPFSGLKEHTVIQWCWLTIQAPDHCISSRTNVAALTVSTRGTVFS